MAFFVSFSTPHSLAQNYINIFSHLDSNNDWLHWKFTYNKEMLFSKHKTGLTRPAAAALSFGNGRRAITLLSFLCFASKASILYVHLLINERWIQKVCISFSKFWCYYVGDWCTERLNLLFYIFLFKILAGWYRGHTFLYNF